MIEAFNYHCRKRTPKTAYQKNGWKGLQTGLKKSLVHTDERTGAVGVAQQLVLELEHLVAQLLHASKQVAAACTHGTLVGLELRKGCLGFGAVARGREPVACMQVVGLAAAAATAAAAPGAESLTHCSFCG